MDRQDLNFLRNFFSKLQQILLFMNETKKNWKKGENDDSFIFSEKITLGCVCLFAPLTSLFFLCLLLFGSALLLFHEVLLCNIKL